MDDYNEDEMFTPPQPVKRKAPVAAPVNPLAAHFRLPGLSIRLPTGGAFFPEGGVVLDAAGEVAVYPMRAADEILLSSPDALMNNSAIVSMIRSCVPAIKMPELVTTPDLDALLMAIRIASGGETMDLITQCPKCQEENTFVIDLPAILSAMADIPPVNLIRVSDDIVVYLRPHTITAQTKILLDVFKETRAAQAMDLDETLSEEDRSQKSSDIMQRLTKINFYGIAACIEKIVVPTAEVDDQGYILEFIENTDKNTLAKIRKGVEALNAMGITKTMQAQCPHCEHEWDAAIEFNPATFFAERSSD